MSRRLGTVLAIAARAPNAAAPAARERVHALAGCGLAGDIHADPRSPRQLLLAGAPAYRALGLPPHALRENLLLDLDTAAFVSGTVLRIGAQVRLRLSFQCEACGSLDRHAPGLAHAIGARRGILARVLAGGEVRVGDPVAVLEERLPALPEDWRERVARVIEAVPPEQVIGYADLAHVAGVQSSYCRAFPRLLARLGPTYAARAVSARAGAALARWDGTGFHAQAER
ncbi:MAG: MOSC domain-containing protein [Janthinobacterium lividum]